MSISTIIPPKQTLVFSIFPSRLPSLRLLMTFTATLPSIAHIDKYALKTPKRNRSTNGAARTTESDLAPRDLD